MVYNKQLKKDLFKLVVSNPDFIYNMLKYEISMPMESKDENNNTLLNRLLIEDDVKSVNLLLNNIQKNIYDNKIKNMLLNDQNEDGNAPIHIAILNNKQDIAKMLYKLGADMTKANKDNFVVEYSDDGKEKTQTCNRPMPDINKELFSRPMTMPNPNPNSNISYVIEIEKPNQIRQNEMQIILDQLSAPVRKMPTNIPVKRMPERILQLDDLESITSTEIPIRINSMGTRPPQLPQQNQMNEFDFLKNFLEKDPSSNPRMSDNQQTISTQDFMRFLKQNKQQHGGANDSSSINTNEFIKYISQKNIQDGGYISNEVVSGTRKIKNTINKYDSEVSSVNSTLDIGNIIDEQRGGRKKSFRLDHNPSISTIKEHKSKKVKRKVSLRRNTSRSISRPSSDLHQEVVDILKKNYSLSEDDARYIKAGFYHMIKDKFPNLSNMQRALKLKEMSMDENEVNQMKKKLPELKEIVTKARELKKNSPQNSSSPKSLKEPKKTKEPKEKKTVKKK